MSPSPSSKPVCVVFISYFNPDKDIAYRICNDLERAAIWCWIAPRDIFPGDTWSTAIVSAIDRCHVMVLVFSSKTEQSVQVIRELDLADAKRLPVIPVRIENVEPAEGLRYYLGNRQWLDACGPQRDNFMTPLLQAVKAYVPYEDLPQITPQAEAPVSGPPPVLTADAALEFSKCLLDQNEFEEAITQLQPAIRANYPEAYNLRGWAYKKLEQYEGAVGDYGEAIRLEPYYARAFLNRGIAYRHLNRDDLAIQDYDRAIAIREDYSQAYYQRGYSYCNLRQYKRAIEDLTRAIQLAPGFTRAVDLRDQCRREMGENV